MKAVVFDVDETLGYFTHFGVLWSSINDYRLRLGLSVYGQKMFDSLLDHYPEYMRPNIFNIMLYLKNKKKSNPGCKIIIYTNNQGGKDWVEKIKRYIENKIHYQLIDEIIGPYKINNLIYDKRRTSRAKTHNDLIQCANIRTNTNICFIDDTEHSRMINKRVLYIKVRPYIYYMETDEIINRFMNSECGLEMQSYSTKISESISIFIMNYFKLYKNRIQNEIIVRQMNDPIEPTFPTNRLKTNLPQMSFQDDDIFQYDDTSEIKIGEKIMKHLKGFFSNKRNKTGKIKFNKSQNKTLKRNTTKKKHDIEIK